MNFFRFAWDTWPPRSARTACPPPPPAGKPQATQEPDPCPCTPKEACPFSGQSSPQAHGGADAQPRCPARAQSPCCDMPWLPSVRSPGWAQRPQALGNTRSARRQRALGRGGLLRRVRTMEQEDGRRLTGRTTARRGGRRGRFGAGSKRGCGKEPERRSPAGLSGVREPPASRVSEDSFGGQVTVGEAQHDRVTPGPVQGQGAFPQRSLPSHRAVSTDHHKLQGHRGATRHRADSGRIPLLGRS